MPSPTAPAASPPPSPAGAVLLDLDGTLLDTEKAVAAAARATLAAHGAALPPSALAAALGRRPRDAWAAVVDALADAGSPLPDHVTPDTLLAASEDLLRDAWGKATPLPGAVRLTTHLRACGVKIGLVTSTPAATLAAKTAGRGGAPFKGAAFDVVVTGDDPCVEKGKPAPDAFLAAAAALNVPPSACVAVEDSPAGVAAARAAGMRVVYVPSVLGLAGKHGDDNDDDAFIHLLPSLLLFDPPRYGLPPFTDAVEGAIPLAHGREGATDADRHAGVIFLDGTVARGHGRGAAQLGIPTANIDAATVEAAAELGGAVTGIYAALARLEDGPVFPVAASIGVNPHFSASSDGGGHPPPRTVEPWILAPPGALPASFYGARLRLAVVAFLRPERAFDSVEALVSAIHADAEVTRRALAHPVLAVHREHPGLVGD